ncbi:MAG: LysR family transcriptional regulator [Caulobacteraceae bacterium]
MIAIGPLKVKVQLFCADAHAMGPGKADLLEAIDREGSISAAGRALGMSYRKCWMLTDRMNRTFVEPLVKTDPRGASLTDLGRQVAAAFRTLEDRVRETAAASRHRQLLLDRMKAAPVAADRGAGGFGVKH